MKKARLKFLIHPKYQLTTISFHVIMSLLCIVIFYVEHVILFNALTGSDSSELMNDPAIIEVLQTEKLHMHYMFIGTSLVVTLVLVIGGLILSNKVAGPVYRLNKHMNEISEGQTEGHVRFRKGDFFPELAEAFNRVWDKLKG